MNVLKLETRYTDERQVFNVFWSTGLVSRGLVRVTVPALDDAKTAAELVACQYLLVDRNVCGHDKAGAGLVVQCSSSEIPALAKGEASEAKAYLARYATFLRTRFLGAMVQFDDSQMTWIDSVRDYREDTVTCVEARLSVLTIPGIGDVEITAHAVEKYIERFQRPPRKAWKELLRIAKDGQLTELPGRRAIHDLKHRRPGRYVVDKARNVMLVIAAPRKANEKPRLVTVVRPA